MTNEQAKYILENERFNINTKWNKETNLSKALEKGIKALSLIPDNATNGEMLTALFGKEFFEDVFLEVMHYGDYKIKVTNWWNEQYKGV